MPFMAPDHDTPPDGAHLSIGERIYIVVITVLACILIGYLLWMRP